MFRENVIFNNEVFKRYDNMYFVSADGKVYSSYSNKVLKNAIDISGYKMVDIHGKHMRIHRLVYLTWIGEIPKDCQINHKDDNKHNNHYTNLYAGTQKENMMDKSDNGHSIGNTYYLTVLDKKENKVITFCPAYEFIGYSHHSCKSGSLSKMFKREWFRKGYKIVEYKPVKNLKQFLELKGVSTMGDECNPVG